MEKGIISLGEEIIAQKYLIAELIQEETEGEVNPQTERISEEMRQNIQEVRADFIELLGWSLIRHLDEDEVLAGLSKWGAETGNYFLALGVGLDYALLETNLYRKHLSKLVKSEAIRQRISVETLFNVMELFHSYMDYATYSYSTAYLETYRRRLAASRRQFLELSAPVVPVTEKIAILPLVGDIDLDRGRFILERVLQEATRLDVDTLILDLSGVVQVDENVVEQMTKITRSLKIVGINPVLTGIRPEIAKMMVAIGINKGELLVGGTLKQVFQRISKGHFA